MSSISGTQRGVQCSIGDCAEIAGPELGAMEEHVKSHGFYSVRVAHVTGTCITFILNRLYPFMMPLVPFPGSGTEAPLPLAFALALREAQERLNGGLA